MKKFLVLFLALLLAPSFVLWASGAGEKSTVEEKGDRGKHWVADGLEMTFWCEISPRTTATRQSHNEVPVYQEAEKLTGIKMKYLHPPAGQEDEQFNLMLASADLADIIDWDWQTIPGGPEKAIRDGVVLKLNDLIKQHGTAVGGYLNTRPDIAKMVITDEGSMYVVPFLRPAIRDPSEAWQRFSTSHQMRNDWLKKLGLKLPETIDETEKVLRAFKAMGPNIIPISSLPSGSIKNIWGLRWFMSAWGSTYDWYVVDGKMRYGSAEPSYKEFLTYMNRWYKDGLIDPDFMGRQYADVRALILEDRVASFWGLLNRDMGGISGLAMKAKHPTFELTAAPWPKAPNGKSYNMAGDGARIFPGGGAAITTKNKNPVEAMKWLNFWWTEDGHNLGNFGIEGLTYNWVDGFPKYTELITNNPDGLSIVYALCKYAPDGGGGRFWRQDSRYWQQMMALPQQFEAGQMLAKTGDISIYPPPITPTAEESRELASILAEINTYRDEMCVKFIVGDEPLSKFDAYIAQIKKLGIDRAIAIQQAALDRFAKRPVPKF